MSFFVSLFYLAVQNTFAQTWSAQSLSSPYYLNSVSFGSVNQGWAVGLTGAILNTSNAGSTWTAQTSGTTNNLWSVSFVSATQGWVTGNGGMILTTSNGGSTWTAQTSGTGSQLYGVHFVNANYGWAVGNTGKIVATTNGGSTWVLQASGLTAGPPPFGTLPALQNVYFTNTTQGWAVGGSGTIITTSNGGNTWTSQTSGTTKTLVSVYFISATQGWAVGASGIILSTSNGGVTWASQTSGTTNTLNSVYFTSVTQGWAVGSSGFIVTTSDGGSTWTRQTSGTSTSLQGVSFNSAGQGLAVLYGSASALTFTPPPTTTINSITANNAYSNGATETFSANFGAAITGLSAGNFSLSTTGNVSGAGVTSVSGSGSSYTVTVNTGSGDGTIGLNLANAAGLAPGISTTLPFAGGTATIDETSPSVTISAPSQNTTTGSPVNYTVTYADANFNTSTLSSSNIILNSTGTANGTIGVTGSGTSYTVTVSGITGTGSLGLSIGAGTATDLAGNTAPAAGPSGTFTVLSTDATLSGLVSSGGSFDQTFAPGTINYTESVASTTNSITITPTTNDPNATVTVNGNAVTSGTASGAIALNIGNTAITTVVTAQDGVTINTYTLNISRAASLTSITSDNSNPNDGYGDVEFQVIFDGAISGLNAANFSAITTGGLSASVHGTYGPYGPYGDGNGGNQYIYEVDVTYQGTGGTIALTMANTNGLSPAIISGVPGTQSDIVAITPYPVPTLTIGAPSAAVTAIGPVSFPVTYTGENINVNLASGNINVSTSGTAAYSAVSVTGSGTSYTITLSGISGNGQLSINIPPGTGNDDNGNQDSGGTSSSVTVTNDATLSNLALNSGSLSPAFAGATVSYTDTVVNSVLNIAVTPTTTDPNATLTVNGNAVISGAASAAIPLNPGINTITTIVTAQDGITINTYTLTVIRAASNDATLSSLAPNVGSFDQTFSPASLNYTESVSNTTNTISITPTTSDQNAVVKINGNSVNSGAASGAIPLNIGINTITTVVTAQDGVTINMYTITVTRAASNDATLSSLAPGVGSFNQTFAPATTSYTENVPNAVSSISLTPTANDPNISSLTVNGTAVSSGSASGSINLNVGVNTITTMVLAQDGTTIAFYTLTVSRAALSNASLNSLTASSGTLSPAFTTGTTSYVNHVSNGIASLTVTPTTGDPNATVTVNGSPVTSGTPSATIPLAVGTTTITTSVTAQDGTTTHSYVVLVTRSPSANASLSAIKLNPSTTLTSVAGPDYKDYTASVSYATNTIQVTPTTADNTSTVTVNGVTVASGTASGPISLNLGSNTITIVVTAQDGKTTHTNVVTVTHALSNNAELSAVRLNPSTVLTAVAGPDYKDYIAVTGNGTSSIQVIPTTAVNTSTVTVNGVQVVSGTASGPITLMVGTNTITVVVTAQDGTTIHTSGITITRTPSSNASLSAIKLNPSKALTSVAGPDYADYTALVTNATSSIQVIPTTAVGTSTVTVNGITVASGTASGPIALAIGTNAITVVVTAQNGVTTHTYGITINRAAASLNGVYEQVSVSNPTDHSQMMGQELNVHQGLSPNGDGINDFLMIDGIANYPDNHLQIMNRSGQLIFEAKGYDNSTKVFDGHSNKNGAMQLPGTYFYQLDYAAKGVTQHKTGFIVIKY